MSTKQKWPTISLVEEDRNLIEKIRKYPGVLCNADQKNILMIAATLAVELDAPDIPSPQGKLGDVIHSTLLSSYDEYQQYILLIFFATRAHGDLSDMSDIKVIVDNFIDYGHRGLQILKSQYLESPRGNDKIQEKFIEYLSQFKK